MCDSITAIYTCQNGVARTKKIIPFTHDAFIQIQALYAIVFR